MDMSLPTDLVVPLLALVWLAMQFLFWWMLGKSLPSRIQDSP